MSNDFHQFVLFSIQGRLLDDPVMATLTTNDDNEDGELGFFATK